MNRTSIGRRVLVAALSLSLSVALGSAARADIPAGYKGTPFDPAVAGGMFNGMPTTSITTAGPYPIPGRLEFENYDLGGLNVGYFTTDHIGCAGGAYRKDGQTASLCATSPMADTNYGAPNGDVFYDTGTSLDGMTYPNATTEDVYIGAVRPGDWVNITVNVTTAGTYVVGSTWASGNGNPGKEGGDGAMELKIFTNGTMVLDWKDTFPNFNTTANFHNWKTYPNMGTVTLPAGIQVIKLQSVDPHLNLDYVQFSLPGADGGASATGAAGTGGADAGATAGSGAAGASGGSGGAGGAAGTTGAGGQLGTAGEPATTGSAGQVGTAGTSGGTSGGAGAPGTPGGGAGSSAKGGAGSSGVVGRSKSSGGCAYAAPSPPASAWQALAIGAAIALGGALGRRRRRDRR